MYGLLEQSQVLYEIAMDIGTSLDLQAMLKRSLQTILRKLNCLAGGVWRAKRGAENWTFEEILTVPRNIHGNQAYQEAVKRFLDVAGDPEFRRRLPIMGTHGTDDHFCIMDLPDFGLFVLVKGGSPLSPEFVKSFSPINQKLANACQACVAQEEIQCLNRELDQRVRQRTAELEAANRELEAFAYSVSHDLRAPLRSLDGFSMILLKDCVQKLDEKDKQHLLRIRSAAQRMEQLIEGLLTLSRVTRAEIRRQGINLSRMAREIVDELVESEPQRNVHVTIMPGMEVQADPQLLRVALTNLLGNAWKFTGTREQARIEFLRMTEQEAKDAGYAGTAVFYIRDNGAGFDMAYAQRLFSPFQRLHGVTEFPGTGIGLATVRRIIQRHGGRVWAEGHENVGATFYFTLE